MNTMLIELTNPKAINLLRELEELHLIKVLNQNIENKPKLSDKYRGILTQEQGKSLDAHIKQMRTEWDNI